MLGFSKFQLLSCSRQEMKLSNLMFYVGFLYIPAAVLFYARNVINMETGGYFTSTYAYVGWFLPIDLQLIKFYFLFYICNSDLLKTTKRSDMDTGHHL